jgi:hypothetical protein
MVQFKAWFAEMWPLSQPLISVTALKRNRPKIYVLTRFISENFHRLRRWAGHGEIRNAYKIFVVNPEEKRLLGRLKRRSEDRCRGNMFGGCDWISLSRDRDRWRSVVNTGSIKGGKFLD